MPFAASTDRGAMATVYADGGYGYAATGDTSPAGLAAALERAAALGASHRARRPCSTPARCPPPRLAAQYRVARRSPTACRRGASGTTSCTRSRRAAGFDPRIVDWEAGVEVRTAVHRLVTSAGGDVVQQYRFMMPGMSVTAHADGVTQTRSLNGYRGICQQGGVEVLARFGFAGAGRRIAEEALELLAAPNCPSGAMDVLLAPDQMILQIHESIGHPLELDRILGDERNFAGTSFVTPDMFGTYRYGSDLLNVTFDPTRPEELASYAFDDDGTPRGEGPPHPRRHPASARSAARSRRRAPGCRAWPTRAPTTGTARRSTAWPISTSSRATRRSTSWSRASSAAC